MEELHALNENSTQDFVDEPESRALIGNKWVYSIKLKPDGTIDRYKDRPLVSI